MKKLNITKTLTNLIKGSLKAKIITGIIGGVLVGGFVGGTVYYLNNKNNPPEYKIAGTDKAPKDKELERTNEEKEKDEKQVKLIGLKDSIKVLDPNVDISKTENDLDKDLAYYEKLNTDLDNKVKEELGKKEEEEKKTNDNQINENKSNVESNNGGESNSSPNTTKTPSSKPDPKLTPTLAPTPTPTPEQIPTPKPVDPVRLYDLESQLIGRLSQENTNKPTFFSSESLSKADKYANLFIEDAISSSEVINGINGITLYPFGKESPSTLKFIDTVATKATINGKPGSIGEYISSSIYMRCKIVYDANSDKSTLWVVSSEVW
ncbi:hypothetical protein [Clostridium gasigenes]|uniref:Uncharacterized protein n=1 Tax=Clostridium gasigenes TaxID=94869 RepID=A0A7X0SFY6_9CLOT|nr:hypothetical protein [Clostridium gasigenes]MBB6716877.1 hypothetical protein [Clostridium gasigenes]